MVGLEALARWEHPDRGRIEPETFIPLAERDERTIWELTLLAVDRSLGDVAAWGEVAGDVTIFVNLSSVSLARRDLAAAFSPILEQHRFPPSRLAVEVTETALVGLPDRAAHALDALKQLGMRIVLDDFGEGYSSITRLGRLPFDTLKVDLSLIGLPSASDASRVLKAIVQLAHSLGLQIVAECIEDDEIRDELTRLGPGPGVSPVSTVAGRGGSGLLAAPEPLGRWTCLSHRGRPDTPPMRSAGMNRMRTGSRSDDDQLVRRLLAPPDLEDGVQSLGFW